MIKPIDRAPLTSNSECISLANCKETSFLESSITSLKTQSTDYKRRVQEIFNTIWSFIKTYFLFLCFESEDKDRAKHLKQLAAFIELYFQAAKKNPEAETANIVREFGNLSKTVQEDVKQAIENIYRGVFPNKAADFYKRNVKQQIESPFDVINRGEGEREVQVFAKALLTVKERYAGFQE